MCRWQRRDPAQVESLAGSMVPLARHGSAGHAGQSALAVQGHLTGNVLGKQSGPVQPTPPPMGSGGRHLATCRRLWQVRITWPRQDCYTFDGAHLLLGRSTHGVLAGCCCRPDHLKGMAVGLGDASWWCYHQGWPLAQPHVQDWSCCRVPRRRPVALGHGAAQGDREVVVGSGRPRSRCGGEYFHGTHSPVEFIRGRVAVAPGIAHASAFWPGECDQGKMPPAASPWTSLRFGHRSAERRPCNHQ